MTPNLHETGAPIPGCVAEEAKRFGLVGQSRAHLDLLDRIAKVAGINVEILIDGPTGVGKELYARYIHERSARPPGFGALAEPRPAGASPRFSVGFAPSGASDAGAPRSAAGAPFSLRPGEVFSAGGDFVTTRMFAELE